MFPESKYVHFIYVATFTDKNYKVLQKDKEQNSNMINQTKKENLIK